MACGAGGKYRERPTRPPGVERRGVGELVEAMRHTGFQGRKLGEAVDAWVRMLREEDLTIFLGLSGAMVPAGMRRIIAFLIRERLIDCLVSTGANLFHDCHEALGGHHYQGAPGADDEDLHRHNIDRIYDIYGPEEQFREIDRLIAEFSRSLSPGREYSTREFMALLGEEILKRGGAGDSIVVAAHRGGVPIFVPALADSSIGIGLTLARREGWVLQISPLKDVDEITQIVEASGKTGAVFIGGGVPKNFIQQTEVITSLLDLDREGHDYAIQFTTDAPHWGGLSGCTLEEAVSWGKVRPEAKKVQCFVDATIALPIVSHALAEREEIRDRRVPHFSWGKGKLSLEYRSLRR
jgi:deoxyhypusine synthase